METNWGLELVKIGATLAAAFGGGYMAFIFQRKQNAQARKLAFVERQIEELYAPLSSGFADIRRRRKVGDEITDDIEQKINTADREEIVAYHHEQFQIHIDFDLTTQSEVNIPIYRDLLARINRNEHLADPELRPLADLLTEYLALIDRILATTYYTGKPTTYLTLKPLEEFVDRRLAELRSERDQLMKGKGKSA